MFDCQGFVTLADEWGFKAAVGPAILACLVGGGATVLKVSSKILWWSCGVLHRTANRLLTKAPPPPTPPPPPLSVISQKVVDVLSTKEVVWDPVKGELLVGNLVIHHDGKLKSILADKKDILPRIKDLAEEVRVGEVVKGIIDYMNMTMRQAEDRLLIESICKP